MSSNKVCHLTAVHRPFDGRIFLKECRTLVNAGYAVVLIAPHDRDVVVDGVTLRGISPPRNRMSRMLTSAQMVYRVAWAERADIYHFHDPELIPAALALKARGCKVIYDVHENLPTDILNKNYLPAWSRAPIAWIVSRLEGLSARRFDRIIAATPTIARRFPAHKTVTVQNFPLPVDPGGRPAIPFARRTPLIAYVGLITKARGILEVVEAVNLLPGHLGAKLTLAGQFYPASLQAEVLTGRASHRVEFLGWLDHSAIGELLGRTKVGLATHHLIPAHLDGQPTKLFDYMGAGLPVVASDFPLWRTLVETVKCGLVVDPMNPLAISEAIRFLLTHPHEAEEMGRRGQAAVAQQFSWAQEAKKLLAVYDSLFVR